MFNSSIKSTVYLILALLIASLNVANVFAVEDPRLYPINKVGINLLSPDSEIEEAARLVNNNGEWGWVLIIIKKDERNVDRWQSVFHKLAKNKLIPIVRLATEFDKRGYWQKPTNEDAAAWADFLSKLYWPTKNRYVQVYNEVNHSQEWGGTADAPSYAEELSRTIDALKNKDGDFYVLNAPLDLAVPTSSTSLDAETFYKTMANSAPGIFDKLDGWASHSYPNPGFVGNPTTDGKLSIKGYEWEQDLLAQFTNKELPVFITETGWKRETTKERGLDENTIANNYKYAFEQIWKDEKVVAVTPFVFHFPDDVFGAFSFKSQVNQGTGPYYKYYYAIQNLIKGKGNPKRENLASMAEVSLPSNLITNLSETGSVKIKNIGNEIWKFGDNFVLNVHATNAEVTDLNSERAEIMPGETANMEFKIKGVKTGDVKVKIEARSNSETLTQSELDLKSESLITRIWDALRKLNFN